MSLRTIVIAGDFHIPHQDPVLLSLFVRFLEDFKPDILVLNGDFLDCWAISKFSKVPTRPGRLKDEIDLGKRILEIFRKTLPDSEIYYIEGNHEFRLRQYLINNAPEIYELLEFEDILGLNEFKIEWVGTKEGSSKWIDTYKRFGKLYVGHWDRVNKHSAYTAKALVEDKGVSLIQNHVHRIGQYNKRLEDGTQLVGIEAGCMCDLNPDYTGSINWQQGFVVAYLDQEGSGRFHAYPIHVLGYKFFFNGKVYDSEEDQKVVRLKIQVDV